MQGESPILYGRLGNLIPHDQQVHGAAIASRNPMLLASPYPNRHQSPQPFSRAEKIIPSIEGSFSSDQIQQNPFAHGPPQDQHGFGYAQDTPRRPRIIQLDVESDHSSGKRRRVAEVEPSYTSNYYPPSRERPVGRTVLIPLDQYEGTLNKGDPFYNIRPNGDLHASPRDGQSRSYLPAERPMARPMQGLNKRLSGESYRLPAETFATDQVIARPHLQVQLKPLGSSTSDTSLLRPVAGSDSYQTLPLFHSDRSSLPYSSSDLNHASERERNPIVHEQRVARLERVAPAAMSPSSPNARGGKDRVGVICVPQYPRQPDVAVRRELPSAHVAPARAVPLLQGRGSRSRTNFRSDCQSSHEPQFNPQDANDHSSTTSNRDRVLQQQHHQFPSVLQGHPNVPARISQSAHDDSGYVLLYTLTSSTFYASCKTLTKRHAAPLKLLHPVTPKHPNIISRREEVHVTPTGLAL